MQLNTFKTKIYYSESELDFSITTNSVSDYDSESESSLEIINLDFFKKFF